MKNNYVLPIVIAIIALLLIGAGFYIKNKNDKYSEATLPLPVDIGGGIGNTQGDVTDDSGISGKATIDACAGPVTGDCANQPYAGDFRLVTQSGAFVKTFLSDSNGNFKVLASPGVYKIEKNSNTSLPKMGDVGLITVKSNTFTNVNIKFDSGMQ